MHVARSLLLAVGLASACGPGTEIRDVRIDTLLPSGDARAPEEVTSLRIEVWPTARGLCRALDEWAVASCGERCDPPPGLADSPLSSATLEKDEAGSWSSVALSPGDAAGAVEVVVRGLRADSTAFLHGCREVDLDQDGVVTMPLSRAWCAPDACAPCEVLDCAAVPVAPATPGDPRCLPVECTGEDVCCDGACVSLADDPAHCGACGSACGEDEACCEGECANVERSREHCGACGTRCDGGFYCGAGTCDPFCVIACVAASECGEGCPEGDWCDLDSQCRCGDGPACGGGLGCCDGRCLDLAGDAEHCGTCGTTCVAGQDCVSGACT